METDVSVDQPNPFDSLIETFARRKNGHLAAQVIASRFNSRLIPL